MRASAAASAAAITAALLVSACGDESASREEQARAPFEGTWQSREKLSNGKRNRLTLEAQGGSLEMYVKLTADGALSSLKYDVSWELDEEEDINLTLQCTGGCPADHDVDFKMECVAGEGDLLDCKATAPFESYGFFAFEPEPIEG